MKKIRSLSFWLLLSQFTKNDGFVLTSSNLRSIVVVRNGSALRSQQQPSQQEQLQEIVNRAIALEDSLALESSSKDITIEEQIDSLEQQMQQLEQLPLGTLSSEEYAQACWTILQLPVEIRVALWYSILQQQDEDETTPPTTTPMEEDLWECATNVHQIPRLIHGLYEQRASQNNREASLQQGLLLARNTQGNTKRVGSTTTTTKTPTTTPTNAPSKPQVFSLFNNNNDDDDNNKLEMTPEELRTERMIQQLLPRVTRQKDRVATESDLAVLLNVLRRKEESWFVPTTPPPRKIPGGYCISGFWKSSSTMSITEQLKQIEEQGLPKSYDAQLCWLPDVFSAVEENDPEPLGVSKNPVLLLTKRDFTPTVNPLWNGISSLSAMATSLIFIVGIYGGNELVMTRLTQPDFTGIDWFNGKILDLLLPLTLVPFLHLSAQSIVAQMNHVKLSFPVLLPFWPLPWMGTIRRFNNSPESRTALANVALAGPIVGLLTSSALLVYGLQLTALASPEVADYFPTLPVQALQWSTAGGAAMDSLLGGAPGFYTTQTSSTAIPLHPLAVAGYVSLLMQAVDLLPLGATNGGRLSLALLGRQGHSVIGGLTWLILLLASLSDAQTDVLVGAWIVNNVVQNDPEVPCRNEVDPVGVPQAVAALFLWFVAALILTPLI